MIVMRKFFVSTVVALGLILSTSVLYAQPANAFKVNMFSPIVKTGSFFFEHQLNEKASLQLGVFYTGFKVVDTKFSGYGITPEYRLYPSENAISGFYVAPFVRYQSFSLEVKDGYMNDDGVTEDAKATFSSFGGGIVVGRQWLFGEFITFDMFIGPQLNGGSLKVKSGDENDFELGSFSGFGIRLGVTLGVAF
jgi:hypothetical protein